MGAGSDYDMDGQHRQYSVKYSLSTADGVKRLLTDMHRLRSARFERGDYSASDILLDLDSAIMAANLTIRQRQIVYYRYEESYEQEEVAQLLGIERSTVSRTESLALTKIAEIYAKWNYEEIEVTYIENIEEETENVL